MHRRPSLLACLLVLCTLAAPRLARAQFETSLTLNKTNYLAGEAVEGTVTVVNRSGSDIVMGGPNGQSWLRFEVTGPDGSQVPAMRIRTDETFVFKAGGTKRYRVYVSDTHPFGGYGNYSVAASIYHPLSQQSYLSNRVRANFSDTKGFWEKTFGVPMGLPNAGQVRRYDLVYVRDADRTYLYVRLVDQRTDIRLCTYSLGQCIMVSNPQITIDASNNLHVLFMTLPHVYVHVTMDTQGKLGTPAYYKDDKTTRPQLVTQADQRSIGVSGGVVLDPNGQDPAAAPKGRSVSDRPPGL